MNCGKFETVLIDLARADVMDAALRAEAAAHAENCAPCAARLADERALTQCLRAFASASENIEAPPQIETALRAAFQKRAADTITISHSPAPASTVSFFKAKTARRKFMWAAIAAMLFVAFGLTAATLSFRTQTSMETATTNTESSRPVFSIIPPVSPPDNETPLRNIIRTGSTAAGRQTSLAPAPKNAERLTAANYVNKPSARRINHSGRMIDDARADIKDAATMTGGEGEIATDFLPLVDADSSAAQEGGQLVRVEMPRTALAAFGLPMNVERADEPVKADVVVGVDGLARAIRFVR